MSDIAAKQPIQSISKIDQVRADLSKMLPQFKLALPENVTPEKFVRVILTAIQNTPALLNCERQSLYSAAMRCAQEGLLPDGKEAAFIPYNGIVQYQCMVGGIYKKIRNSGLIAFICADVVYAGDGFQFWTDENGRHIEHRPKLSGARGRSDNVIAAFALAKTKDGDTDFEVMTKEEIEFVRSKSKSKNSPAWAEWWGEMSKKTVVKRLAKRLPTSADVQNLIDNDNEDYELVKSESEKTKSEELSARLGLISQQEEQSEPISDLAEVSPEFEKAVEETPDPRQVK